MADQETEITLGTGKLLGLFFGLVVLCAVFFVTGYSLGKSAASSNAPLTDTTAAAPAAASGAIKPAATQGMVPTKPDCANTPEGCQPPAPEVVSANQVENTPPPQSVAPVALPELKITTPEVTRPAPLNGNAYVVQVAAVSKQQDAEALVTALRKKQYQVFVANQATDPLFHIQIGPFSDAKEAEAVRNRLVSDGYNPIVKR